MKKAPSPFGGGKMMDSEEAGGRKLTVNGGA
jgi:hypothetical protein